MSVDHADVKGNLYVANELHVQLATRPNVGPILHQLPSVPPAFTAREDELSELEQALTLPAATGELVTAVGAGLQGMSGVGKTALAIVLAHRLKIRYPDAQLFLNLRGADPAHRPPLGPADVMQLVIHAFHPETHLPESVDELGPIYRSVLTQAGRVLVLLDDAYDADQVRPLFPPPSCVLLVTSRQQFHLPGIKTKCLDCLSPDESRDLLHKLAPSLGDYADTAARLCGYLPLALEVFARVLAEKRLYTAAELVERLHSKRDKFVPVEAAFQVSYEVLSQDLQLRLAELAVFPASFDLQAVAAVWNVDADMAREEIQRLVNGSLVKWNDTNYRFSLHDLILQFCEGKLADGARDTAKFRHARHFQQLGAEANALCLRGGEHVFEGLSIVDRELKHFEAALDWICIQGSPETITLLFELVSSVSSFDQIRFHPRQRIRWYEAQRMAACTIRNREAEGNTLRSLGCAYADLGDSRKAVECAQQSLLISREIGDRCLEGDCIGNLGCYHAALGDAPKAIDFYQQALVIHRELGDQRGEGANLNNIGLSHDALSDAAKAIDFYQQALVIHRELGDRRGEGASLNNIGLGHFNLGDVRKAIDFYQQALVIDRQIGDRSGEAKALGNLGNAVAALGDVRMADDFIERACVIHREIGDRRAEGTDLCNLCLTYTLTGNARKAIACGEQARVIFREIGERRGEAATLCNLGRASIALGDPHKAIKFCDQALTIHRDLGDRNGEGSDNCTLGIAYAHLGDALKAIAFHEQALSIHREVRDRRGEGSDLGNLGHAIFFLMRDARTALTFFERAMVVQTEVGDRQGKGGSLYNSAIALKELGDSTQAIARAEAALAVFIEIASPEAELVRATLAEWRE